MMRRRTTEITLSVALLTATGAQGADELQLARAGRSDYRVVIAADAPQPIPTAAEEFVHFFQQITGAKLAIVTDAQPMTGRNILIGPSSHLDNLALYIDWDALGNEGYVIRTWDDSLLLFGGARRGTINAVYAFLDDYLGCRWYTPDFSVIPKSPDLSVDMIHVERVPPFRFRRMAFAGGNPATPEEIAWVARSRLNYFTYGQATYHLYDKARELLSDPRLAKVWLFACRPTKFPLISNHSLGRDRLLPQKYFKEHPEYFGLTAEGKRDPENTPCLTNPDVFRIVVENAKAWLNSTPGATIVSISQADQIAGAHDFCHCPRCTEGWKKFSYTENKNPLGHFPYMNKEKFPDWGNQGLVRPAWDLGGEFQAIYIGPTGVHLEFCNRVAEALHDDYPDVLIHTFAYYWSKAPPEGIELHPNVLVAFAPLTACNYHTLADCTANEAFNGMWTFVRRWRKLTPHVMVWRYDSGRSPRPTLEHLALQMREYEAAGVACHMFTNDTQRPREWLRALRLWLYAKLLWDPRFDMPGGVKEFVDAYYGNAAETMLTYVRDTQLQENYDMMADAHSFARKGFTGFHSMGRDPATAEAVRKWDTMFDAAEAAVADDPVCLDRVRRERLTIQRCAMELLPADDPVRVRAFRDFFPAARKAGMHEDSEEVLKKHFK